VPVPAASVAQARAIADTLPIPLELPSLEYNYEGLGAAPEYSDQGFRSYSITAPGGTRYPIYVAVFATGLLGQYYDVQGTTWLTAPLFDHPSETIKQAGRTYYLYYSGRRITQIVWFAHGGAYWVRNTIPNGLNDDEMLAVAESTAPVTGAAAGSVSKDARHQTAAPSTVALNSSGSSALHTIGVVGGVIALFATVAGMALLLRQRMRLDQLRRSAEAAASRAAALEGQLARVSAAALKGQLASVSSADAPTSPPRGEGHSSSEHREVSLT